MPKFLLAEFVEPELDAIWEYIAIDNIEAADRFVESAYGTFQELARMPGMGRVRRFPQARLRALRSFRVNGFENYLIFYCPISDGIEVLHILHGARDLESFWEGR
ncbi:MAG: type II toxin-antitoxin system RelE/ParE family toxin [Verrucomicrobiota bacterium]|jgi:toxin ParE1/3/4